jgi:hypothetical protein
MRRALSPGPTLPLSPYVIRPHEAEVPSAQDPPQLPDALGDASGAGGPLRLSPLVSPLGAGAKRTNASTVPGGARANRGTSSRVPFCRPPDSGQAAAHCYHLHTTGLTWPRPSPCPCPLPRAAPRRGYRSSSPLAAPTALLAPLEAAMATAWSTWAPAHSSSGPISVTATLWSSPWTAARLSPAFTASGRGPSWKARTARHCGCHSRLTVGAGAHRSRPGSHAAGAAAAAARAAASIPALSRLRIPPVTRPSRPAQARGRRTLLCPTPASAATSPAAAVKVAAVAAPEAASAPAAAGVAAVAAAAAPLPRRAHAAAPVVWTGWRWWWTTLGRGQWTVKRAPLGHPLQPAAVAGKAAVLLLHLLVAGTLQVPPPPAGQRQQ